MNTWKSLKTLGFALLVSLALSGQSVDGRDKKDDKKKNDSGGGRGHSPAPAHVSSSSHGKQNAVSPSHGKQHLASVGSSSSRSQHQGKPPGDKSVHKPGSVAHSPHPNTPKTLVTHSTHSRSGNDPRREHVSPRALHENVPHHEVVQRSHSDHRRVDHDRSPRAIDHSSNRSHELAQNQHSPRVIDHNSNRSHGLSQNHHSPRAVDHSPNRDRAYAQNYHGSRGIDHDSRRGHDNGHHSTWYRSGAVHHRGVWRDDPSWCADRSWDWHHHHRYYWNGAWVIGDYPRFGYDPGIYSYDPQPLYPVSSTGVAVQRALAEQGYYDGPVDGVVGEGTRGAIADYQSDHNLPVTGLIDDELMANLGLL